jgi:hypothetical protein
MNRGSYDILNLGRPMAAVAAGNFEELLEGKGTGKDEK